MTVPAPTSAPQRLLRCLDPRRSLATAIGWLAVALSLAFATAAATWLGAMARTSLLQQHSRQLALSADQLAAGLDQAISSRLQSVRAAAAMLGTDSGVKSPQVLRAVLDELQSAYPELEWIGLADPNGAVVAATGGLLAGSSVAERPWFAEGLKAPWIGDAHRLVDLTTPVRDRHGRAAGVLGAHLSWRWVRSTARGLREKLELPGTVDALLLNRDGLILVGPRALEGRHWQELYAGHGAPAFERLEDGQAVLVAGAEPVAGGALQRLGWRVQLIEPANQALQRPDALWLRILWVSLGLGGGAALLGVLAARHLTRRLGRLTRSVEAVGAGAAQRLEVPSGVDEVALVGAAFERVLTDLQRERGELRTLSAELEQRVAARTREVERLAEETRYAAVVRERLKMARDLHDTLAHSMMAMLAQVRFLRKLQARDPAALPEELARAEEVAHQGLKEARAAIKQMRFNAVRDVGLGAALADAIELFSERTGLSVDYTSEPAAASFADERAEALFRIAEEALRNVGRHAAASRVAVSLRGSADGPLELTVEDDGAGFDPDASYPGHYGVVGLREQAQLIGASLTIASAPHKGTALRLSLRTAPDLQS